MLPAVYSACKKTHRRILMPDYERERMVAIEAARLAGQLCLAVRREMLGENPDEAQIEKAGKEPVTIADYGAQAIVLQRIGQLPGAREPARHTLQDQVLE